MKQTIDMPGATVTFMDIASAARSVEQISQIFDSVDRSLLEDAVGGSGEVIWSYVLTLLEIGNTRILIDTGFEFRANGDTPPGTDPVSTSELLAEAGVDPAAIDIVVITHAHGDHIGGLRDGETAAFPNCRLAICREEFDFWTGPGGDEHYGAERLDPVRDAIGAYSDRTDLFEPDAVLYSGDGVKLASVPAPGHTPGHVALHLTAGSESLWLLADTAHAPFQLAYPLWSPRFDVDPQAAASSRRRLFGAVAELGERTHFFHFAFPGLGRIERHDDSFAFLPETGE